MKNLGFARVRPQFWLVQALVLFAICISLVDANAKQESPPRIDAAVAKKVDLYIEEVANQSARPSPEFILQVFSPDLLKTPGLREYLKEKLKELRNRRGYEIDDFTLDNKDVIDTQLARHIAHLEFLFPNGTYAYLGRDSAQMADLVEAFYLRWGVQGRVRRVEASSRSFVDENLLEGFLETSGFRFENLEKQPPYVLIDTTSYKQKSQSYQLIYAGVTKLKRLGFAPNLIAEKFNVGDLWGRGHQAITGDQRLKAFAKQSADIKSWQQHRATFAMPMTKTLTYSPEWHAEFGYMKLVNGKVVTTAGPPAVPMLRQIALVGLLMGMIQVMDEKFLERVATQAWDQFKYRFELPGAASARLRTINDRLGTESSRAAQDRAQKQALEDLSFITSAEVNGVVSIASPFVEDNLRLTKPAVRLIEWYEFYREVPGLSAGIDLVFLRALEQMWQEEKLWQDDLPRAIVHVLKRPPSDSFLEAVSDLISRRPELWPLILDNLIEYADKLHSRSKDIHAILEASASQANACRSSVQEQR